MQVGLKERLIGAIVLVILAVIIIPWVLKGGSAPNTAVTQPLTLPPAATSSGQPAYHMDLNNTAISQAAAAGSVSAPTAVTHAPRTGSMQGSQTSKAVVAPLAPPAHPSPGPVTSAVTETGVWAVQAGSYGKEANARSVQSKLTKHGYHAYISRFHKGNRTYYRVRVGPYADRAAAERVVSDVGRAFGGKAVVVPNT